MSVTLGNLGTNSLVGTASSTTLATKGVAGGTNITITSSSTDVTIAYNTPYCRVTETSPGSWTNGTNQNLTYTTELNDPTGMHSTSMNTDRINIATTGLYACNLDLQVTFTGTTTGPIYFYMLNSATVIASTGENWRVTTEQILINLSCIVPLSAGDYVVTRMNNTSGLTVTPVYSSAYSPLFSVCYVGSL